MIYLGHYYKMVIMFIYLFVSIVIFMGMVFLIGTSVDMMINMIT